VQLIVVLAGLDPAIHALTTGVDSAGSRVDARVKPAHDGLADRNQKIAIMMRPLEEEKSE